jgi:PKD repeat protein
MNAVIQTQRSGLLQNACDKPCNENISASFQREKAYPLPGEMVSFTNASTGATTFQWQVDDVLAGNDAGFAYTFPAPGKYKVV